jgi:hypothetical protein
MSGLPEEEQMEVLDIMCKPIDVAIRGPVVGSVSVTAKRCAEAALNALLERYELRRKQ